MIIKARTIPHKKQKYNTIGNYGEKNGVEWYEISKMKDVYERACFLHEFVENTWRKRHKISLKEVDDYDRKFEELFKNGKYRDDDEPGDQLDCPYYAGHRFAKVIEMMFIASMFEDWEEYDGVMMKLIKRWRKKT